MKKQIFKIIFLALSVALLKTNGLIANGDCPPVKRFKQLYTNDKGFQHTVNEMLKNVQDLQDGTVNPWRNKNINDLYNFMNEWFYFLPNTQNGLDRIIEFTLLYYHNPAGMRFILEEPGRSWSLYFVEERGKYMDSEESAKAIESWLDEKSLKHEDFIMPADGFKSFNEFFTRNLKPGARPVDAVTDNSILVSPADGVINMINNNLQLNTQIPTKAGKTLSLEALLDSSKYCEKFIGGTALAVFLKPDNYHYYHAPVSGILVESKEDVGDRLFGMPDIIDIINNGNIAYNKDYSVFENFRHGYFIIQTQGFGFVAMVPIGLQTIGSVVFEDNVRNINMASKRKIYKGQKLGHFAYGGSTVLLMFEKGRLPSLSVQQGQRIGKFHKNNSER